MREIQAGAITDAIARLSMEANFELEDDVQHALEQACESEESPAGKEVLRCEGWIKPANSIVFFLTALYDAFNKSGKEQPEPFDGAYLMTRYRSEYDLPEIPTFVKRVIMPATVAVGKMLGRYEHFKDAPEPLP